MKVKITARPILYLMYSDVPVLLDTGTFLFLQGAPKMVVIIFQDPQRSLRYPTIVQSYPWLQQISIGSAPALAVEGSVREAFGTKYPTPTHLDISWGDLAIGIYAMAPLDQVVQVAESMLS